MRRMKLPYLRTRKYTNKAGETWIGYYYEPPRGSGGEPGVKPKPVALGNEMVRKGQKAPAAPPALVLAKYSELTKRPVREAPADGTVGDVYARWHEWARQEVTADRLSQRTLRDYEQHWEGEGLLKKAFANGAIDNLTQPVLLAYFDKRSSKDRAKREIAFLGVLCGWAKPRGYMKAPNPVNRDLRHQLKVGKQVQPPVSPEVYWIVWQCGDQLVRDTLDLAYMLATRPAEALRVPMPEPGATELLKFMPKTSKRGRAAVKFPITPALQALIDRRRALNQHTLYILFDEKGQQLRSNGAIRSRLYKARDLAKAVCEELEIPWQDITLQQLRPTAITQQDKEHGREQARKLAGHTTEKQTAHYIRHEAEVATAAALPAPLDPALLARVDQLKKEMRP